MLKKILLFIVLIAFNSACDYSPIHLVNGNNFKIKIIDATGNDEINGYLIKELERKSRNSSEILEVKINTNSSKRILAKNTKSSATDYELKVVGNFELKREKKVQSFTISEKFRYKNMNNNYEQNNYETMLKRNLSKTIIKKLSLRINNLK